MSGEHTALGHTMTATYRVSDAPSYLSHFEITRDGEEVTIQMVKRNGYLAAEARVSADAFFRTMQAMKDF